MLVVGIKTDTKNVYKSRNSLKISVLCCRPLAAPQQWSELTARSLFYIRRKTN